MKGSDELDFSWIELPGTGDNLSGFQEFVLEQASLGRMSAGVIQKIELVAEEILLNIIRHAYGREGRATVRIGCAASGSGSFHIRFMDWGEPFNPLERTDPDTTLSAEDRQVGGLGILLIKKMSDHVKYTRQDSTNILDVSFS
ncbi:ATP-binding protein [Desulfonatronovibrio hydrogenovorans]|uniref:ATP-binding protein n=1 Tax=Desulfonatronovibrio hydrogenovorans TaxID=53245 RepID=UPI00048BF40D|nr:ATP-binding protein [Desulfonatronovibrio hydrogenovorans]